MPSKLLLWLLGDHTSAIHKSLSWLVLAGIVSAISYSCSSLLEKDKPYVDQCKGLQLSYWEQQLTQCMRESGHSYLTECADLLASRTACDKSGRSL